MGVASGETAVRPRVARIVLGREEQFRHSLVETPTKEMRDAQISERCADASAGTETQRDFEIPIAMSG